MKSGDPQPRGISIAHPKDVAEGSWSPQGKEFKDRHNTEDERMSDTAGKFIKAKVHSPDMRAGELERRQGVGLKLNTLGFDFYLSLTVLYYRVEYSLLGVGIS